MEWSIFALVQMFIITVGVSLAFWLRLRGVQKQNDQLREHLEEQSQSVPQGPTAEEWVQEKLSQQPDDPSGAAVKVVLNHLLEPNEDIAGALQAAIGANGVEVSSEEHAERIAQLESELETAQQAVESSPNGEDGERAEELKTLLQQFTRDSREMMSCIQTLETENAELRAQLGLDETSSTDAAA